MKKRELKEILIVFLVFLIIYGLFRLGVWLFTLTF